ncbi:hypothetical protein UlMin_038075 [Ulmus minor]
MDPLIGAMAQTLTQSLFTALMNEAEINLDFRGQFEQMKTRLDLMNAFVSNTENRRRNNEFVKKALTKLREVILKADNVLTDCLVRAEYRVEEYACFGYSLQDPFFFYYTGKKFKDITSNMDQIEKSLSSYLRAQDICHGSIGLQQVSRHLVSQDFNPSEIIGLDDDLMKIKGWIFNTNEVVEHIAIVGMGGLGKTTIAQKIIHDNQVLGRFDKMIWVCVSRAFSEEQVLRCMLQRLGKDVKGFDGSHLLSEIQQVLADKTCLIVMDDVWQINVEWWTNLCSVLPNRDGKKSCIIITTRNEGVASDMGVESSRTHKPNTLNDHDSWCLFSKFAFSSSRGVCSDDEVKKLSKEITKKCGGLPLAIKTIGALLAPRIGFPSECRQILETFHELTTEGRNSSVMASLQLSYDELPSHLKQCLICFCIFPEDFQIRAEQLIHWWMGEGLVQGKGSKSAAEIGNEYMSELIKRCLIEVDKQRGFDGRVYDCKMHDMVRELIIKNAEEEDFCSFDEQGRQRATPDSRWIGFVDGMNKESLKNTAKLRAMLFMSSSEKFKNFGLLRSLRVLDFSNSPLKDINIDDFFDWISSLKRLACLNISRIQGLELLPPSICKLRNLQLFVLTNSSSLKYLHPYITTLKKLIVLDVGFCPNLEYLPCGLGKLSHLQELSGFKVLSQSRKQCAQLFELKEMNQLRVLRISISDQTEISENEMDSLSQMPKLKVLSIDAENCKNKIKQVLEMVDKLTPPPGLQELYLRNFHRETLPDWVNSKQLSRLKYLCVENGDLEHFNVKNVDEQIADTIWNIEGLCLKFLMRLDVDWKDLEKDMPRLRYLEVSRCFKLKDFPCSVKTPGAWRKVQA